MKCTCAHIIPRGPFLPICMIFHTHKKCCFIANIKIFSDSMACAKIKRTKYMCNINENAVQGRLSENYSMQKIIAWNIWHEIFVIYGTTDFTIILCTLYMILLVRTWTTYPTKVLKLGGLLLPLNRTAPLSAVLLLRSASTSSNLQAHSMLVEHVTKELACMYDLTMSFRFPLVPLWH